MSRDERKWSRRDFLKVAGAAGVGSMLSTTGSMADDSERLAEKTSKQIQVPTRPFGNTGVQVPILALGTQFDTLSNQRLMRQAFKTGVTYWETSSNKYRQKGIGRYLAKYPEDRKKIFLASREHAIKLFRYPDLTVLVEESLERLNTSYLDIYLVDRMDSGILELIYDNSMKAWCEKMKNEGKFRFFGISTHTMAAECLIKAVTLGGIDGIQFMYNFQNMHTDRMKEAVDACANAGIGLTAMKTQAGAIASGIPAPELGKEESEVLSKLAGQFLKKGFDDNQARLMAVWQNPHIASITSLMPNMKFLKENVDAALNFKKFSSQDMSLLKRYADLTAPGYCTGCANICESAVEGNIPISDIMRYRMYYHGYGDCDRARSLFRKMPVDIRRKITSTDYTLAEKRCPQSMPIGILMKEAAVKLS